MNIDVTGLTAFEQGLDFSDPGKSVVPAKVLGYGEISSIFNVEGMPGVAFKRMPPFESADQAGKYASNYGVYCDYLRECGLTLPEDDTLMIPKPDGRVVLYIAQERFPEKFFGHKLLHSLDAGNLDHLIGSVVESIEKVWSFNRDHDPAIRLAIDGQISNWVWMDSKGKRKLYYVDTSTPLFRLKGTEQLDPELFLKSAPSFLRGIIRALFLQEVMDHYYDPYGVYRDLAANLYKERRPGLIPNVLQICNAHLPAEQHVSEQDVKKYYREDSLTWAVFLGARRLDRWLQTKLLRKNYEYLLPGKIKR